MSITVQSERKAGEYVEVWTTGNVWRNAILMKPSEPSKAGPGWYFNFDPLPVADPVTRVQPSMGGWTTDRWIRDRQVGV